MWRPLVLLCLLLACCGPPPEPAARRQGEAPREPAPTGAAAPPPAAAPPRAQLSGAPEAEEVERPAEAPEILRVGGDVRPPRAIFKDSSALEALRGRQRWSVCIAETVIARDGRVEQARLLKPENPPPEDERLIVEMLESWRFEPATLDGEPVAVFYHLSIVHCPILERAGGS